MAEGAGRLVWDPASEILAMLHNVNCTKKSDTVQPYVFHPYKKRAKVTFPITALKGLVGSGLKHQEIKAADVRVASERTKNG